MSGSIKVLLYADWPLALTYLNPLSVELQRRGIEHAFAGDGFDTDPTGFDVVVTCDELSVAPPAPLKICIFHGMASKAQAFSTLRRDAFVNTDTVFSIAGPYYRELLLDLGVEDSRIIITGLTKHDSLQRKVLYAPTHNPQLSAIPVVRDRIYEIDNVTVHLHQWIRTGDRLHHEQFRSYYPFHEDREDISDLLQDTDVIIGDFGSIILEGIVLGKQAIQVVNPQFEDWYIKFRGVTWEEMARLPEVHLPTKHAKRVYSFDELKEHLTIAPVGGASAKIVDFIQEWQRTNPIQVSAPQ